MKEILDNVTADIAAAGGKVETTQKMDKRPFARVADKKSTSGFYVNVIFEAPASAVPGLRNQFAKKDDVFRVMLTQANLGATAAK